MKITFEALEKLFDHKWIWANFKCPKCKIRVDAQVMMETIEPDTLKVLVIIACPNEHGYKFNASAHNFLKMISRLKLIKRTTNGRW